MSLLYVDSFGVPMPGITLVVSKCYKQPTCKSFSARQDVNGKDEFWVVGGARLYLSGLLAL